VSALSEPKRVSPQRKRIGAPPDDKKALLAERNALGFARKLAVLSELVTGGTRGKGKNEEIRTRTITAG
jgi:hypothetical protein